MSGLVQKFKEMWIPPEEDYEDEKYEEEMLPKSESKIRRQDQQLRVIR